MNDRGKVIDHLKMIIVWAAVGRKPEYDGMNGRTCEDVENWTMEALQIIEADTPRLLKVEEIKNLLKRAVVWEEYRVGKRVWNNTRPLIKSCYGATLIDEDGEVEITDDMLKPAGGKQRRIWSGNPDQEQRRAAKWE